MKNETIKYYTVSFTDDSPDKKVRTNKEPYVDDGGNLVVGDNFFYSTLWKCVTKGIKLEPGKSPAIMGSFSPHEHAATWWKNPNSKNPQTHLEQVIDVLQVTGTPANNAALEKAKKEIKEATRVFVFGNGGSCATADHLVCDLIKACGKTAVSLSSLPTLTAYANDDGYGNAIKMQLDAWGIDDWDVLIFISTSGNSKNVVKAAKWAKELMLFSTIVALTAYDGGELGKLADIHINVPTDIIEVAEDVHSALCHAIVRMLKSENN